MSPKPDVSFRKFEKKIKDLNIPNHEFIPLSEKNMKKVAKIKWGDSAVFYQAVNQVNINWKKLYPDQVCPIILGTSRFI